VVNKINQWDIKLLSYIDNEIDRAKVEMIIQKIIDEYYQFLYMYEFNNFNNF
jgi:hypothetical protein